MAMAQRKLHSGSEAEDVARVLRVLHRSGPLPLGELADEPELADWPSERVEHALVSAWSHALIFIDTRDLLVAL
ncbi:MAG: hypothetical protein JF565_00800 [Propionibacteriales bacterium]|jgi:hypothetical protein|nr:hypothetical protein [Propionibacteriales bacterium]